MKIILSVLVICAVDIVCVKSGIWVRNRQMDGILWDTSALPGVRTHVINNRTLDRCTRECQNREAACLTWNPHEHNGTCYCFDTKIQPDAPKLTTGVDGVIYLSGKDIIFNDMYSGLKRASLIPARQVDQKLDPCQIAKSRGYGAGWFYVTYSDVLHFKVLCDGGGWIVMQRKTADPPETPNYVNRLTTEGFHWMGLEYLAKLSAKFTELRMKIAMKKTSGEAFNFDFNFTVGQDPVYRLTMTSFPVGECSSVLLVFNNTQFQFGDRNIKGTGWWFQRLFPLFNPNGVMGVGEENNGMGFACSSRGQDYSAVMSSILVQAVPRQ